jgi:hypothetical protein
VIVVFQQWNSAFWIVLFTFKKEQIGKGWLKEHFVKKNEMMSERILSLKNNKSIGLLDNGTFYRNSLLEWYLEWQKMPLN